MNDRERELWVLNDEGLYNDQRRSGLSVRSYIRQNRAALDAAIADRLKPPPPRDWRYYAFPH